MEILAATQIEDSGSWNRSAGPLLLTAEHAAISLGICRTKVYELLRSGELESVRIGASRRIPAAALSHYVEGLRAKAKVPPDTWGQWPTVLSRGQSC